MKTSEQINDGASTPAAGAAEAMQVDGVIAYISTLLLEPYPKRLHRSNTAFDHVIVSRRSTKARASRPRQAVASARRPSCSKLSKK
ncbi:hypothetical protein EVAR_50322_1 [Eumeta japonica]|uniref:Uncharacterized protein n=1 Tax=Eumeta variegata TaxID=151549 RepID=A0A4C1XLM3_EUMVA|nr:hypothetical protein EVAR_50322_1 [Eumeta japonica]